MKILGVNISHDFSVCLYENKIVKELYFEERFIKKKYWIPKEDNDIFILSLFKKINFIPDIVIYSSFQRTENTNSDEKIIKKIQKQLDNPPYFFEKKNHHIYHACSSFYHSKLDEAMSIVIDGGGSCPLNFNYREICSIFYVNRKKIFKLFQHLSNYESIFLPDRFPLEQEYSELGYTFFEDGAEYISSSLKIGGLSFKRACKSTNLIKEPGKLMGLASYAYSKEKFNLNYEEVEIAKKVQEKSFKETCELIEKAYNYKKIKNFVLSGGYFLNCSNNFKYVKRYPEFNFFVDPNPSDGGTSIGACVYYDNYK
jgi:predicted NodU family carbamoyl transferase